ncbi:hypothetical protein GcM3_056036 [Golovinomyces cichoracearum]|uniref:Uncharacterized protein n=1 Tax=Golovinomyces cichoracearum TaxID=62708 RepID=A0A420IXQ5_9PEZI|nr:hypothetical protein GcM3_056036 [Golovinomyces cichoracearum]
MENTGSTLANGSPAQNPTQNHPIDVQIGPPQTLSRGLNKVFTPISKEIFDLGTPKRKRFLAYLTNCSTISPTLR